MTATRHCPNCGRALPNDAPEGICPGCLAAAHFGSSLGRGAPPEPLSVDEIQRLFPELEILALLGQGGMGAVYKARQPQLDRLVALKILHDDGRDPGFVERFSREAKTLARLSHPGIVAVHDFGQRGNLFFLLMELVDGVTLRHLLAEQRMKPEQALTIVPAICDALQYAHEKGIVHRDIKPENILIDREGRVKVADFGIARLAGTPPVENLTGEGQVIGTAHYMAPEQVERPGEVDHRADIYALGVVFYEMLTGELPLGRFPHPSRKVQIDVRLDEVVLKALEKEPEQRYQQAREVKTATEAVKSPPPLGRQGPRQEERRVSSWLFKPFERIRGPAVLGAGIATLLVTALAGWHFGIQTDGVLDLHYAARLPLWVLIAQGVINWTCMVLLLLPFGFWLGKRRFSFVDLFGTQALARLPYLAAILFMGLPPVRDAFDWLLAGVILEAALLDPTQPIPDLVFLRDSLLLLALSIPIFLAGAWMVWLMFHGYKVVFGLNWWRSVWSFLVVLLAAEIISKFAIYGILREVLQPW